MSPAADAPSPNHHAREPDVTVSSAPRLSSLPGTTHGNRERTAGLPLPGHQASWIAELERAAAEPTLSAAARSALIMTIDAFADEDGYLAEAAEYARTLLAAGQTESSDSMAAQQEGLSAPRAAADIGSAGDRRDRTILERRRSPITRMLGRAARVEGA
ncbi:MAG TPA: hypothetical protein VMT74_11670 [Gaiellaceae bacterium]|nr:hypothetical protein [Gaiellaceae bacterium]